MSLALNKPLPASYTSNGQQLRGLQQNLDTIALQGKVNKDILGLKEIKLAKKT